MPSSMKIFIESKQATNWVELGVQGLLGAHETRSALEEISEAAQPQSICSP